MPHMQHSHCTDRHPTQKCAENTGNRRFKLRQAWRKSRRRTPVNDRPRSPLLGWRSALNLLWTMLLTLPALGAPPCEQLLTVQLTDAHIEQAQYVDTPAPHCKATGLIGGKIGFSIWLPSPEHWNRHFLMGGAGGFVREEDNHALQFAGQDVLARGYVTASSDTGHRGEGLDNSWALNDWEAIVNYGHLGMHRTVVTSKEVIAQYYGARPTKSFFIGCSNGGRQALHEAQRYPQDFDGIIAGAPALDFTGVTASFLNVTKHLYPSADAPFISTISAQDRQLLRSGIVAQCDGLDGVQDGIVQNPNACRFDITTLGCSHRGSKPCLSDEQLKAIQSIYTGPRDTQGRPLHQGFPFGAEDIDQNGWGTWLTDGLSPGDPSQITTAAYAFGVNFMRHFVYHDPSWRHVDFNADTFDKDTKAISAIVDATDPNLSAFRAQGGKLLLFHGWSDAALSANMTSDYVRRVYETDATAQNDVRLFMLPGVLHCSGGPGPWLVNWVQTLEDWHASGVAPNELSAGFADQSGTRKLCAWPLNARLAEGDENTSEAYRCE